MTWSAIWAWSLAGLALGGAGTWLARIYALRRQLIDQPGERRSHQGATPRGGGIAIVAVVLAAIGVLAWAQPARAVELGCVAVGLALVAGIGWADDHRPLSPLLRLVVHVLAAIMLCIGLWHGGARPLDLATAFVAAVVLTNVWNFMDGIDGIAASQAALAAIAYALFAGQGPVLWLALAVAAGASGFLPFNFPKARIFMGDVGSGALGYMLAVLLACTSLHADAGTRILLLWPLTVFLVDATLTLASRIVEGERWWQPHTRHAYQAWARRRGHRDVTIAYAFASSVLTAAALAIRSFSLTFIMLSYTAVLALGGVAWMLLRDRCMDSQLHPPGDGKP